MLVQDLMSRPVITCHVNDPLAIAAQRMWDHDCGALVVVNDEGKATGMITDRDICMAAYTQGRALEDLLVNGAMSKHVTSIRPDQPITAAEQLMTANQIRRIPVVDADGIPQGILSLTDLTIEAARPDTRMKQGATKIAQTLAAVCRARTTKQAA